MDTAGNAPNEASNSPEIQGDSLKTSKTSSDNEKPSSPMEVGIDEQVMLADNVLESLSEQVVILLTFPVISISDMKPMSSVRHIDMQTKMN